LHALPRTVFTVELGSRDGDPYFIPPGRLMVKALDGVKPSYLKP
jgi:hypothetical protein